jgi:Domain of unknown function (DUF397)
MDLTGARWRKSSYSGSNGGDCVEVAEVWRKSSYSAGNGGNCVEVAAGWQKSSHSGDNGGDCVEVARPEPAAVAVRDSKDPDGPKLIFTPDDWSAFTAGIRTGALLS